MELDDEDIKAFIQFFEILDKWDRELVTSQAPDSESAERREQH